MTITEFLLARIAEDEDNARRAGFGWGSEWDSVPDNADDWSFINATGKSEMVGSEDADVIIHISRHDPARVLAECAAKLFVLDTLRSYEPNDEWGTEPDMGKRGNNAAGAVRCMASMYADHPDYLPEWAPQGW